MNDSLAEIAAEFENEFLDEENTTPGKYRKEIR